MMMMMMTLGKPVLYSPASEFGYVHVFLDFFSFSAFTASGFLFVVWAAVWFLSNVLSFSVPLRWTLILAEIDSLIWRLR